MDSCAPRLLASPPSAGPVRLETTDCPLCDGIRFRPVIEAGDPLPGGDPGLRFAVVQCQDCGLCFTNPRPDRALIGRFYPDDYACYRFDAAPPSRGRSWDKLYPLAELLPGCGRLLDFGCGAGDFLVHARHHGWHVTGLDFSERMVEQIRTRLGLPALAGSLPHAALPPESFEAVTMWQALEHVHQPLDVVRAARQLLTPGGRLVIAVPNLDSLPFAWFGADWNGLELPRHLTHFTPPTLRYLLERAGLRVRELRTVRHNGWLRHSARLAQRYPRQSSFWCRLLKNRLLSSWAGWYTQLKGRANGILAVAERP